MAQIKIYGLSNTLNRVRANLSDSIHNSIMVAFEYPAEKRFHRFIAFEKADFIFPADRSSNYIVLEISIFEGRTVEAKKHLIQQLFENIPKATGIAKNDIELTIFETPRSNWGIRGMAGDELSLNYKVEV